MEQSDVPFDVFELALSAMPDLKHVELQGEGEPLMYPRFFDMVELCRGRGVKVSFITNGSFFSDKVVDRILEGGIALISVSIESADPAEFQAIRGGKLDKVTRGIALLMERRRALGCELPRVGFNISVLKRTLGALPRIVELYHSLGLDGGLGIQMLQEMEAYVSIYKPEMQAQRVSEQEVATYQERMGSDVASLLKLRKESQYFFADLFRDWSAESLTCAWLERAAFVNKDGDVAPCCMVKDTQRYGLGNVARDTWESIASRRDVLRAQLKQGEMPRACASCPIAEQVVHVAGGSTRPTLRVLPDSVYDGTSR